jgi:predicted esterase
MSWMQFGFRRVRPAKRAPEALVALLHDVGASAATLTSIAARWAATVPTTAFIALDGTAELDAPPPALLANTQHDPEATSHSKALDRAARALETLLEQQLRSHRLDAARLVLVGFGYGGTLALHLLLRQAWSCAGVLAFAAHLPLPLPRVLRVGHKVRLITYADSEAGGANLREVVAALSARGVDTRGVLLSGPTLSEEAIRHGAAYLVELVATAQRANLSHVNRERSHA